MRHWTLCVAVLCAATCGGWAAAQQQAPDASKSAAELEWERQLPKDFVGKSAFAFVEEDPSLPRALLIGDSISIGYTVPTRELLKGKANVLRIPTNGQWTTMGLEKLDVWLGDGKWDVIHFNWGLHDLKRLRGRNLDITQDRLITLEQYEKNLDQLVTRLKKTGAKLIWASTTPVPEGANGRLKGDAVLYNEVAARVMKRQGVPVDDLYAYVLPHLDTCQKPADVHFTGEGSAFLAKQVALTITRALEGKDILTGEPIAGKETN